MSLNRKFLLLFERAIRKLTAFFRKRLFLAKVVSCDISVRVDVGVVVNSTNVTIGKNVHLFPYVTLWGDGPISIGDNTVIGHNTIIFASKNGGVHIGRDTAIAANGYIIDSDHGTQRGALIRKQELVSEPIIIGRDVWIAQDCTILKGSNIADGAVIGAKSLVKGDIEQYGIAVGIPARVIKHRK